MVLWVPSHFYRGTQCQNSKIWMRKYNLTQFGIENFFGSRSFFGLNVPEIIRLMSSNRKFGLSINLQVSKFYHHVDMVTCLSYKTLTRASSTNYTFRWRLLMFLITELPLSLQVVRTYYINLKIYQTHTKVDNLNYR